MALPTMATGKVIGQFLVGDGSTTAVQAAQGIVIFTAAVPTVPNPTGGFTLVNYEIVGVLDAEGWVCTPLKTDPTKPGTRGVNLAATDAAGVGVNAWTWTITSRFEALPGSRVVPHIIPFDFDVHAGKTEDLAKVAKVPNSTGTGNDYILILARAEAIAAVATLAGPAVAAELDNAGVVTGAVRTAATSETADYHGGFIGENGRPTDLVFDKDGRVPDAVILDEWAPRMVPKIGVEKATGFSSTAAGGLVGENGRETDIVFDVNGRIVDRTIAEWATRIASFIGDQLSVKALPKPEPRLGLGRSVYVRDRAGDVRLQTSRSDQFLALGDSLTDGFPRPPYASDGSDSWPGVLQGLLGKTVHNLAVQGQTADEIAIRAGSLVPYLMPEGGVIPASGSVAVTNPGQFITWRTDRQWGDSGTLAGVPGRFARNGGQPLLFTRSAAGAAVTVATPQPWISNGTQYSDATTMMMLGRNDVGWASTGTAIIDRIVAANVAVIESRTPLHPRFLVMGTLNSVGEYTNSGGWTTVTESNRILSQMYPDNYLDIRSYLVHESIYDQGITPTADDLARMSKDAPPTSIMLPGDGIHYTQATAATVARRVHKELKLKGWAA